MFQAIIEDMKSSKMENGIDGYIGFLFYDDDEEELKRMEEFRKAQVEIEKKMMQKWYRRKCSK